MKKRKFIDAISALILLLPSIIILFPFFIFPLFYAIWLSLWGGKRNLSIFVGLGNYFHLLQNPMFWQSFKVTIFYALITVPTTLCLGFVIAYLLSKMIKFRTFFRVVFFIPYVTSTVAMAMVWRHFYNPQVGIFNYLLSHLGVPPQQWLLEPRGVLNLVSFGWFDPWTGPSLALVSICLYDIWHTFGFVVVVFLSAFAVLPKEYYESAKIDGAKSIQILWHIELPLLSPTWLFLITVLLIRSFQSFSSFYALSPAGGRALRTTENLMLHIYSQFYEYGYWGYGSAVAIALSISIMVLTFVQWRWTSRYVFYQ